MKKREGWSADVPMPARAVANRVAFTAGLISLAFFPAPRSILTSASQAQLQNRATQLSQQISAQSSEIRAVAVQAASARARLVTDQANLAKVNAQLSRSRAELAAEKQLLVSYAIAKFTDAPGSSAVIDALNTNQNNVATQSTYENVASGYVVNVITAYRRDQQAVTALVASDARDVAAASQTQQSLAQDLVSLQSGVAREQATLTSVHGQIAVLVQQRLQQEAVARQQELALAARRAAQQQAAQQQAAAQAAQQQAAAQAGPQPAAQGAPSAVGVSTAVSTGGAGSQWGGSPAPPSSQAFAALRNCESGGNYQDNTGNGYYGAYQFSASTWAGLGFSGLPSAASPSTQDQAAQIEQRQAGWAAWPECSLILGLD
ncbi:transglycosylase family protein [Ferrimicrobium acidiphilum]|nr:transglycosylase family protein [Ferrimicrobium acidiphilum]